MELVLDQRILWDSSHLKQIDQAKAMFLKFKKQGYQFTKEDKVTIIEKFHPALEVIVVLAKKVTKRHKMVVLNDKGDERVVWDKNNGPEAKQAKERFNELIEKGWKAYSVHNGEKNRKITEFDVDAEEILMVPETARG